MADSTAQFVLRCVKRAGEWFIIMPEGEDCGPYKDKDSAESDARGMERTYKYHDTKGFITCDQPTKKS